MEQFHIGREFQQVCPLVYMTSRTPVSHRLLPSTYASGPGGTAGLKLL